MFRQPVGDNEATANLRYLRNSVEQLFDFMKRTPLFSAHQELGAKLIEFGGWEMPVYYSSIVDEHQAVRLRAGLFDISHMGEVVLHGQGALEFLNAVLTNDLRKLAVGQGQYTLMCNPVGGVVDDLYAYRIGIEDYLLVINASRIEVDFAWLLARKRLFGGAVTFEMENASDRYAALALQGPQSAAIIDRCYPQASVDGTQVSRPSELRKNQLGCFGAGGKQVLIGRTGYTGEDGFELILEPEDAESAWKRLVEVGAQDGLKPAGLGARDTLRTEVCYPLYGHELNEETTPIEAGLGFFVALDKGDFVGRDVLIRQKAEGTRRKLVAFKMTERSAPPRPHYPMWSPGPDGAVIGEVTSGTQSPSLSLGIGLGYVNAAQSAVDTPVQIEIRGKRANGVIVTKPIYRKAN